MKITLDRLAVKDALKIGRRPLETKGARYNVPARTGVHIIAGTLGVTFERTDLNMSTSVITDGEVHDNGEVLAEEKTLRKAVQRGDDQVTIIREGDTLTVENGAASLTVPTFDLDEWPQLPKLDGTPTSFDAEAFDRLTRIASAASDKQDRPELTGIHFSGEGVAATDSYRLHWAEGVPGVAGALVPASLILDAAKEAKRTEAFDMLVSDERVSVSFDTGRGRGGSRELSVCYMGSLIEGSFPNWWQLLPDEHDGSGTFQADDLLDAVKALEPVTKQHKNTPAHFQPVTGRVSASFNESTAKASVDVTVQGTPPESIAFNPSFLTEAVEAVGAEQVRMSLRDSLKPAIFTDARGEGDVSVMLMPVRT